jgi:polyketide cyclase/dehydrase/lipid transport protein
MTDSSTSWPPSNGLTTIVVPRENAIVTTAYSCRVAAPASLVFDVVRNVADYPSWNTFIPRVTIHSQPEGVASDSKFLVKGTSLTFHCVMDSNKPTKETLTQLRVTDMSTPEKQSDYVPRDVLDKDGTFTSDLGKVYRISWGVEGGFVARGLHTERFHEVIVLGENECEVRTWEQQGGILARTVKWFYDKTLNEKFKEWCDGLKKFSEEKVKGSA